MMRFLPIISAITLSLSLAACQSTPKMPTLPASTNMTQAEKPSHVFQITGKIGVRTPQQTGSAFYAWHQQDEDYIIDITGAFGIGQTRIQGTAEQVQLSNQHGTISADNPEQLLKQATGWHAPISQLRWWVNGQTASTTAQRQLDEQGRISEIQEQGWHAKLHYDGEQRLPTRLNIVDENQQNRITLTIQSRQ